MYIKCKKKENGKHNKIETNKYVQEGQDNVGRRKVLFCVYLFKHYKMEISIRFLFYTVVVNLSVFVVICDN